MQAEWAPTLLSSSIQKPCSIRVNWGGHFLIVFSKFWSSNQSATIFGSKKIDKKDKFSFQRSVNHNVALSSFQFDLWNNPEFLTEAKKNHRHSLKNINYILLGCGVEILFLLLLGGYQIKALFSRSIQICWRTLYYGYTLGWSVVWSLSIWCQNY